MSFQPGNKLAQGGRKEKPWRDALMVALKDKGEEHLRSTAQKVVAAACDGDMQAVNEIANRLDGKPAQALNIGSGEDGPLQMVITWGQDAGKS